LFSKGHPYYPPKSKEAKVRQYTGYKKIRWTLQLRKKISDAVRNSYTPELRELRRKERLKNPSFTKAGIVRGGKISGARRAKDMPKLAHSAGSRAREYEREMIEKLRPGFEFVASSSQVCDAVAINSGKVYLLEFKQTDKRLKPLQARAKELAPEYYQVHS
jgi:hypothetical protein